MPTTGDPQFQSNWHTLDQHNHQSGVGYGTTTVNHTHTITGTSGYTSIPGGSIYPGSQPNNYQWNYGQWQQTPVVAPEPQTPDEVEAKIEELRLQMETLEQTYREMIRVQRGIISHECVNCGEEQDHDPDDYICLGCREAE
jgi:hypothetical protein